jgi:hypothetical protein
MPGTLVVLERTPGYRERRTDGYEEPLELFLVGTAHVSAQSADDVRQVVTTVQPDAVVVELCRSRQAVMYPPQQSQQDQQQQQQPQGAEGAAAGPLWSTSGSTSDGEQAQGNVSSSSSSSSSKRSNPLGLSGGSLLPAFQRSLELGGSTALLLRLMLGRLSSRLSDRLGVQGGAEFIAAREEAEALGAQLVLGDRPIEITLQRAWDALSWRQRARLARELAGGALAAQQNALDAAAIEQLKDDDAVSLLFDQLSEAYPQVRSRDQTESYLRRSVAGYAVLCCAVLCCAVALLWLCCTVFLMHPIKTRSPFWLVRLRLCLDACLGHCLLPCLAAAGGTAGS